MTRKHTRTKNANKADGGTVLNDAKVGQQADGHSGGPALDKLFGLGKEGAQQRPNEPGDKPPPTEAELKAFRLGRFKGMLRGSQMGMDIGIEIGSGMARKPLIRHIDKLNRRLSRAGQRVAIMRRLLVDQASVNADIAAVLFD